MTSSKSTASRSSRVLVAIAVLLLTTGIAAAGRKRVAVLDFEGADAEKIQKGVIALIKKSHTVIAQDKWDDAASDLGASSLSEKNVKKVAKKLKLDGVISGEVEKRRGEYIIRIKLRAGTTGELVGKGVSVKSSSARLDSTSQDDLEAELVGEISGLDQNRGAAKSDEEDEEEKPKKKPSKKIEEEDEEEEEEEEEAPKKPTKKVVKKDDEEEEDEAEDMVDRKPKKGFSKRGVKPSKSDEDEDEEETTSEDEEEDNPLPAKKRPAKKDDEDEDERETASSDEDEDEDASISRRDDEDEDEDDGEGLSPKAALAPGERAVDAVAGLSITMRRLGFKYGAAATVPNGYKGAPVPGVMIDATIYPGAIGHKRGGIAENIGATILVDKVLLVSSQDLMGNKLASSQLRWELGAVARYPLKSATVGASLKYGKQSFSITGDSPVPDVAYSYVNPSAFVRITATPKILVNVSAGVLGVLGTGEIQQADQYGGASVLGLDFEGSADYALKSNLFVRAALNIQSFAFTFKGNGTRSMDVAGARDSYFGLGVNLGYLY